MKIASLSLSKTVVNYVNKLGGDVKYVRSYDSSGWSERFYIVLSTDGWSYFDITVSSCTYWVGYYYLQDEYEDSWGVGHTGDKLIDGFLSRSITEKELVKLLDHIEREGIKNDYAC